MDVNEVLLPGVGLRYEFTNHDGERIGVVARRTGDFELVVYSRSNPDSSRSVMRLNSEEADTLAEILGAPRMAERFADLRRGHPGPGGGHLRVLVRHSRSAAERPAPSGKSGGAGAPL